MTSVQKNTSIYLKTDWTLNDCDLVKQYMNQLKNKELYSSMI